MTSGQLQLSQDFHGFNENAEPLYAVEVAASTKNGDTDYPAPDYTPSVSSPGEISINSDQSDFKQYVTREQELRAMEMKSIMEKDRQILKINSLRIHRFMSEEA